MGHRRTDDAEGGDGRLLALLLCCLGEAPLSRQALLRLERAAREKPVGLPPPWAELLAAGERVEAALRAAEERGWIRVGPEVLVTVPNLRARLVPGREHVRGAALAASRIVEAALPRDPEDPAGAEVFDLLGAHVLPVLRAAGEARVPADAAVLAAARVAAHRGFRGEAEPAAELLAAGLSLADGAELTDGFLTAVLADQLASALQDLGREAEAREAAARAEREARAASSPGEPRRGALLANVGALCKRQGDFLTAEVHFRRALEELDGSRPEAAALLGPVCLNLCDVLRAQAKPGEALVFARRAVRAAETALGPMHHGTADALESLALVLDELGEVEEARRAWRRVAALYGRHLGRDHPLTAAAHRRLEADA